MNKTGKQNDASRADQRLLVERVQTGVKIEKRILKVLKGLAEYHDISLGDLLEGIVLHVFEGKMPFGEQSLKLIADLKRIYKLGLQASDSHQLYEAEKRQSTEKSHSAKTRAKR